jgi:hypothetical protein
MFQENFIDEVRHLSCQLMKRMLNDFSPV